MPLRDNRNLRRVGAAGEALACRWLIERGYRVRETNYRCLRGEIDIVAEKDGCLAFVEVKYRSGGAYGRPREAVTPRKQRAMCRAALQYLGDGLAGGAEWGLRFDVIEIYQPPGQPPRVIHIENAFEYRDEYGD